MKCPTVVISGYLRCIANPWSPLWHRINMMVDIVLCYGGPRDGVLFLLCVLFTSLVVIPSLKLMLPSSLV